MESENANSVDEQVAVAEAVTREMGAGMEADAANDPLALSGGEDAETMLALKNLEKRRRDKKRKARIRLVVILAIVIAAIAAGAFLYSQMNQGESGASGPEIAYAQRGDFETTVEGSGALNPYDVVVVTPEVEGIIDSVSVSEGQEVSKGDLLFTIRNSELDKAVSDASKTVSSAKRDVSTAKKAVRDIKSDQKKAKKEYNKAKKKAAADEKKAQKAYEKAYNEVMAGPQREVDKKKEQVDLANKAFETAKAKYEKAKGTPQEAAAKEAMKDAEEELVEARKELKRAEEDRDSYLATAEAAGAKAYSAVDITVVPEYSSDTYKAELKEARAAVDTAEDALDTAEKAYDTAVEEADKRIVRAPKGGTLVSFTAVVGASIGESPEALAQIADISRMKVSIAVNETEINEVKKGQDVRCAFSAKPDLELKGRVVSVASTPAGTQEGGFDAGGVVEFPVEVVIDKPDPELRLGMTANVDIFTQFAPDVIMVPNAAVIDDGDGTYVNVVTDEESLATEPRKVKTGQSNTSDTIIKSGLEEGEAVLLAGFMGDEAEGGEVAVGDEKAAEA